MIPHGQLFVIGDSHIGLSEGSETAVMAWIDRLVALRPASLYLNGDLFHYLIADRKFYTPSVERVFARLRQLRDSGVAVHYVEGNRDFFLRGSMAEKAVTDVALHYSVRAGDNNYLIIHGDMINDRDFPYRFWRAASKNPLSRFCLRIIPKGLAQRFVNGVEKKLSKTNFKHKSRLPLELMEIYGKKQSRAGYTHVVLGHFHQKLVMSAGAATLTVLPPWYESGEAMMISPTTGAFEWVAV